MVLFQFFQRLFRTGPPPETAEVLFFGLGNKGGRYARSRHNIGFRIADALARRLHNRKNGIFGEARYTRGTLFESGKTVLSVKPLTFMNRSGDAAIRYIEACRCPLSSILVIVDDYNLPLGRMRMRRSGSDGGHNGLKSIISRINGDAFPRLRVGIGPLRAGESSSAFVLGAFNEAEEIKLEPVIPRAVDACFFFAEHGIDKAMDRFN
ncbi:MAG: aminoacyl-tRNA hydrolase [Chitinispirillaceae bacterium]|nr:aminoacyl-tRNA hydrolase [Chitinispirillaceae bacterium]